MQTLEKLQTLVRLEAIIASRADAADAKQSYTAGLLTAGPDRCARKFGEEAIELILAAQGSDKDHTTAEAADVVYHLLVLLKATGVSLDRVMDELNGRFKQSGLQEKASRNPG